MNNDNPQSLKDKIIKDIQSGSVSMRPRLYFTLQITALILVSFTVLVVSVFIFNFIAFSIRISGGETLLSFGPRGWSIFLQFFPWALFVFDVLLIGVLEWMLRKFRFGYNIPALYLLGGLLVATVVLGYAIDRATPFNDILYEHHGHPLSDIYDHAHRPPPRGSGICECKILEINGSVLMVEDVDSSTTLTVMLPPNDPRATTTNLRVGDIIFIAGDEEGGVIDAFGLHKEVEEH